MPQPQYVVRSYGGGAAPAQLVAAMGSTDTTFTITPTTGWVETGTSNALGTSGPFTVVIDRFSNSVEKILCSSINLSTGVVTVYTANDGWSGRGYDGTTPVAHVPGGTTSGVQTCWSSLEAEEANQAVYDLLGAGGTSSLGVPIGTIIPFAGTPVTLPSNFLVADGSSVLRSSYSALFSALTINSTANTTTGNATLTNVPTAQVNHMAAGMMVSGTNIPSGAVIQSVNAGANTVTLTSGTGVVAGTAGTIVVYPHGYVDSTHFNLPDARSRVLAGQAYGVTSSNTQPALWVGGSGGEKLHTLVQTELSTTVGTGTIPDHNHQIPDNTTIWGAPSTLYANVNAGGGVSINQAQSLLPGAPEYTYSAHLGTLTITNSGGGQGHNNMQPYIVTTHIIRAL
jgi:microcystin-dependent protein